MDDNPIWIKGEQAGYDPETKKYRDVPGRFTTKRKALDDSLDPNKVFGSLAQGDFTPLSNQAEKLEWLISGIDPKDGYEKFFEKSKTAESIPGYIRSRMALSEFYYESEGDLSQTVDMPIDLAIRDLDIKCSDTGIQSALRELYGENGIDLLQTLYQCMLSVSIYGQAFPVEVWRKGELPTIILLPPAFVWVGKMISNGIYSTGFLPPDYEKWTEKLIEDVVPPMMYVSMPQDANDYVNQAMMPVIPEYCMPIRAKALPWKRYAIPPMSRALRAISTRQVLEELVRSTIEGYKNQLWVFLLGSEKDPPSPKEIAHLRAQLNSFKAERTGQLIWRFPLVVNQYAPTPLDSLLGNQAWQSLTWHVFRQLGVNPRLISGETVGKSASGSEVEVDVRILASRVTFMLNQLLRWEKHFRKHWAEREGKAANKANVIVRFGKMEVIEQQIRDFILPLVQAGLLSDTTALEETGFDYTTELERKTAEEPNRPLFGPKATFAQQVVNPDTQESETGTAPQGRPRDGEKPVDVDDEEPPKAAKKAKEESPIAASFFRGSAIRL